MVTGARGNTTTRYRGPGIGYDPRSGLFVPSIDGGSTPWPELLVEAPQLVAPLVISHHVLDIGTRDLTPHAVGTLVRERASSDGLTWLRAPLVRVHEELWGPRRRGS